MAISNNSFGTASTLEVNGKAYRYFAINGGELAGQGAVARLPVSIKILLDGVIESGTGALSGEYGNEGIAPYFSLEELNAIVDEANRRGISVHIHATGDLAGDDGAKHI